MIKRLVVPTVLAAYCLGAYLININVPLFADDYWRVIPHLSTSIPAPLYMAWREYFGWTGRFVVTYFTYLLVSSQLIYGKHAQLFAVVNSIFFATLAYFAYKTATRNAGTLLQRLVVLTALCFMLFWFPQSIGEAALWKTGAINYLWVVVAVLAFMTPFLGILDLDRPLIARNSTIGFSRNFGKEAALSAGVKYATGDAVIPIDVDLQDPIDVIPRLLEQWERGFEVVLAKRSDRSSDSVMKRAMANAFYRLHNRITNLRIEENVGDFRLMDRVVVNAVNDLPENCRFMKGLFAWVGFRQTCVEYVRPPRSAGKTKFNGWRLWNFALEGFTSFSTVPLRVWTYLGGLVAFFSCCYGVYLILSKLIFGNPVPGYPSLMAAMLFLGGVQLIGIGVLGEYIGRTYLEAKRRPLHVVRRVWRQPPADELPAAQELVGISGDRHTRK